MQQAKQQFNPSQRRPKITLLSCKQMLGNGKDLETMDYFCEDYSPQAVVLIPALQKLGYDAEVVAWDDDTINWKQQGLLVLCTVWDYTRKFNQFLSFVEYLQNEKITLVNNPKVVKWNCIKNYLLELPDYGIKIPDTLIFSGDQKAGLVQAKELFNNKYKNEGYDLVVKGLADASGKGYLHLGQSIKQQDIQHFQRLKSDFNGAIMQQFIPEINKKGQFSFVLLAGKLSHFYIKVSPPEKDLVQSENGGQSYCIKRDLSNSKQAAEDIRRFRPDFELQPDQIIKMRNQFDELLPKLVELFKKIEVQFPKYVRVDCMLVAEELMVIELEAVQPYLMLSQATEVEPENDALMTYIEEVIKPYL